MNLIKKILVNLRLLSANSIDNEWLFRNYNLEELKVLLTQCNFSKRLEITDYIISNKNLKNRKSILFIFASDPIDIISNKSRKALLDYGDSGIKKKLNNLLEMREKKIKLIKEKEILETSKNISFTNRKDVRSKINDRFKEQQNNNKIPGGSGL